MFYLGLMLLFFMICLLIIGLKKQRVESLSGELLVALLWPSLVSTLVARFFLAYKL